MKSNNHDRKLRIVRSGQFEKMYERIQTATKTQTQVELAKLLNIQQSSISDAKRRGSIPPDWVLKLFENHKVNPNWIKYGQEPMLLPEGSLESIPKDQLFSCASLGALISELIMRLSPDDLKEDVSRTLCMKYFTLQPTDTLRDVISRVLPGDIASRLCDHIFHMLHPPRDEGDKACIEVKEGPSPRHTSGKCE